MVSDDLLYANVRNGLTTAPDIVREAYNNTGKRHIIEALLLDSETPLELYQSLFGFSVENVEQYMSYFFSIPI